MEKDAFGAGKEMTIITATNVLKATCGPIINAAKTHSLIKTLSQAGVEAVLNAELLTTGLISTNAQHAHTSQASVKESTHAAMTLGLLAALQHLNSFKVNANAEEERTLDISISAYALMILLTLMGKETASDA